MENEKRNQITDNDTPQQPKPNEDVQLEIETVVPSAHQNEVDPSKAEQVSRDDSTSDDSEETSPESKSPETEGREVTEGEDNNQNKAEQDSKAEQATSSSDKSENGDARDDIETVSA